MDPLRQVRSGRVLKRAVSQHSNTICSSVNFQELYQWLFRPELRFLTDREFENLHGQSTEQQRGVELLFFLNRKGAQAQRKFVACLRLEDNHRGHVILAKSIMKKLTVDERKRIDRLVALIRSDTPVSSTRSSPAPNEMPIAPHEIETPVSSPAINPDRPMPPINLVGDLNGESFDKFDRKLWKYFSNGDYSNLETLVAKVTSCEESPSDWKIVASWFQALVVMHRDHDYGTCIGQLLLPALQLCIDTESENRTILEGRIYQRMAQIYLVMNLKDLAQSKFDQAKALLQFVGRGYDKANIFCREAKIRSATLTISEGRDHTETMFNHALDCVPEDAPYALASRPSLILSKAAFHLHISFGVAPPGDQRPPDVSAGDIKKARETLDQLEERDILLSMRKCERQLLSAELLRLEDRLDDALEAYKNAALQSKEAKLKNIGAISDCRIKYIEQKKKRASMVDSLLSGFP